MGSALKSFGQAKPVAATEVALGQVSPVPAGKQWAISTFTACNQHATNINKIRLRIRRAWGGTAEPDDDKQFQYKDMSVPPASTFKATSGWALAPGDVVEVYSDLGDVSFEMEGIEQTAPA